MQINLGIQLVRALATLAVAATHYAIDFHKIVGPSSKIPTLISSTYVAFDFFFIISGFVLVYASSSLFGTRGGPWTFYLRRLIRIIPIYWLATTLYVVMAFALPNLDKTFSLQTIVTSYLFIPYPRLDGTMQPVVGQGWTLNYEMYFYVLFAVAIFAPRRTAVAIASALLIVSVVVGWIAPLPTAFEYWCQPIILEFIFGMTLGLLFLEGRRIPAWAGWLMVAAGLAILFFGPSRSEGYTLLRAIQTGGSAALVVGGLTLGDLIKPSPVARQISLIGDASFSLYLFHSFPNRGVLYAAVWLGFDPNRAPWLLLALALVLATAMSVVMYKYIEVPAIRSLRKRLGCESNVRSPDPSMSAPQASSQTRWASAKSMANPNL
jgi:peptidoglycan/LPS O-acetylase OafA/YrhL